MKKLTNIDKSYLSLNSQSKKFITYDVFNQNYDISFRYYEIGKHKKELKDLKKEDLKEFQKLILRIIKCKNEKDFSSINRGKTNKFKNVLEIEGINNDEIMHIGFDKSTFRLHGIFYDKIFIILCLDPKHEVH